jgi:hypothetical protein
VLGLDEEVVIAPHGVVSLVSARGGNLARVRAWRRRCRS